MDLTERAQKYLAVLEPSISGSNGHNACFQAACVLVHGFALDDTLALHLLASEFNPRCSPPWSDRELRHKINQARKTSSDKPVGYLIGRQRSNASAPAAGPQRPTAPVAERIKKRQEYEPSALQRMMCRGFTPDYQWLAERSPIDPRGVTPQMFLDHVFLPGEKTLIFCKFYSQGEMGHVAGSPGKTYYLADRPGPLPVRVQDLNPSSREGAWFLPSPIDGKWHPSGATDKSGNPILSRRSGASIVCYRHLLLESDDAPESDWLNLICQLPLPISALYTSGGRSIHALCKIDTESKSQFDAFRDRASPLLSKLGADPAAMTGVRLTRLPGILREGTTDKDGRYHKYEKPRLQRLLYLNPTPEIKPLKMLSRLREILPE
jgi:hypothetical protein